MGVKHLCLICGNDYCENQDWCGKKIFGDYKKELKWRICGEWMSKPKVVIEQDCKDLESLIDAEIARQSATSEEVPCRYCIGMESHRIATVKTVMDEYGCEFGYDAPYNFCPNCGRKIKEEQP